MPFAKCKVCGRLYNDAFPCMNCKSTATQPSGTDKTSTTVKPNPVVLKTAAQPLVTDKTVVTVGPKPVVLKGPQTISLTLPKWKLDQIEREKKSAELRAQKEEAIKKMEQEILKNYPAIPIIEGEGMFFRAAGKGQEPWDLLKSGFQFRYGQRSSKELKAILAEIYGTKHGGANSYMSAYRGSAANNPAQAPFISAGIKSNDAQGASNGFWQYAIQLDKGLQEVSVTHTLLGVKEGSLSTEIGDVKLLMDTDNIDSATIIALLHGPLPECTWLNYIPKSNIVAWIRLGGAAWQRVWRRFDESTINGILELAQKNGVTIAQ